MDTMDQPMRRRYALAIILLVLIVFLGVYAIIFGSPFNRLPTNDSNLRIAQLAFNNSDFKTALYMADSVLANDPHNVDALVNKATIIAQEGSLEFNEREMGQQSITIAQQALAINPNSDEAWRIIGYANEIMQEYPTAHDAYTKSLAINPNNVLTISQEAHAYDLQGELDKAEAGYRAALAIDPNLPQAMMGLARILLQKGDIKGALTLFTTVSHTASNVRLRAEAAYSAGMIASAMKDTGQAAQFMNLSTSIDSTYPLGWVGMGAVAFDQAIDTSSTLSETQRNNLITSSFESLQRAMSLNPNQSAAYLQMGVEMAAIGKADIAKKLLQETGMIVPNDITLSASDKESFLKRTQAVLATVTH